MRLIIILLFASFLHVSAKSFSQRINISEKNISLKKAFYLIKQQTGYSFLWNQQLVENVRSLKIDIRNATLSQVLDQCLIGLPIIYSIREKDKIIFLTEKLPEVLSVTKDSFSAEVLAPPPIAIQGKLTNDQGFPLQGVSITIQGTSRGTTSNENGLFTIQANQGETLRFSMIGYTTYSIKLKSNTNLKIVLQNSEVNLSDVVVVGYGTQKKVNVTGAVATVKGAEIQQSPALNIANSLEGRMAGVIVNNRSGAPGDDAAEILIRGKGSWNGSGPLIIVDGIANRSGFGRLNPADIESISVLKDASASIYGSRAANGVILITTKRGKETKANFSYQGNFGITQPTRLTKFINSWQAATYQNEDNVYLFGTPKYTPQEVEKFKNGSDPNLYPNYNIYDLMLKKSAPQTSHALSVRGGTKNIKYYFSGGYLYQDSYFKNGVDNFKSYNIRSNIDAQVNDNLTVSLDLAGRQNKRQNATAPLSLFELMLVNTPTLPLFYSNGLPAEVYGANLVRLQEGKGGTTNYNENILNSQLSFKWQLPFIIKGLYASGVGAFDYTNTVNKAFTDTYDYYKYDGSTNTYGNANVNPSLGRNLSQKFYNAYSNTLNLRVGFNRVSKDHNIDAFVAYEQYATNNEWISASRSVFLTNQIPYLFFGGTSNQQNDGKAAQTAYRNIFGRVAYNYAEKYLVDFTLRRDESVKFANGRRTGIFPGISAGWRLSKENFIIKHFKSIDQLKLRASWGQAGSDAISDFQYLQTYVLGPGYGFGTQPQTYPTINSSGVANPFITWEVSNNTNIGLEGSFKNNSFAFVVDYFMSKRNNILAKRNASVPTYTGLALPDQNIGKTQNEGIELLLKYNNRISKDLTYNLGFNFTYVKNKVLFRDESPLIPDYQKAAGHSIDAYTLYKTDGIFHTQKEIDDARAKYPGTRLGDIRYVDYNGDGVINSKDKVKINESPIPELIYGLTLGIKYKNISLNTLIQGQANAKVWLNPTTRNGNINMPDWMYQDRWTVENPSGNMPRAFNNRSETVNELPSDFWLRDASFIRLKTVEISYDFQANSFKNLGIQNLRLYINGFNLITISNMKGDYDPEMNNALGVYYPQTRIFNAGIDLTF